MYVRLSFALLLALASCLLCGCFPNAEGQSDEQKNEYYIQGKQRAQTGDVEGAMQSFEKAVQINPRSALAHYELGLLYDQKGNQNNDYVIAMYHYLQAVKLRPHEYPAENANLRIQACKQELLKAEMLEPVTKGMMRDFDRLKQENQNLQKQLELARSQLTNALRAPQGNTVVHPPIGGGGLLGPTNPTPNTRDIGGRITPLPPPQTPKTYAVKDRDSFFSIAKQFGVKVEALQTANPSVNPKKLKVGQTINLPAGTTSTPK
jgi:tetratricopeptide (TPR) repeat protein